MAIPARGLPVQLERPGTEPVGLGRFGAYGGRFTVRSIKVVMDGALGSKGAALLEPYADHDTSGFLTHTKEEVAPMLEGTL